MKLLAFLLLLIALAVFSLVSGCSISSDQDILNSTGVSNSSPELPQSPSPVESPGIDKRDGEPGQGVFSDDGNTRSGESFTKARVDQIIGGDDGRLKKCGACVKDDLVELGPDAVPYLISYLENHYERNADGTLRIPLYLHVIEEVLIATGGPEVSAYYENKLYDTDREMRLHAVDMLFELDRGNAVRRIIPLLNDGDNRFRAEIIRILNEEGHSADEYLLDAMNDQDLRYSAAIVFALRDDQRGKTAIETLMQEDRIDLDAVFVNYESVFQEKEPGYELWLCLALAHSGNAKLGNFMIHTGNPVLYYFVDEWAGPHGLRIAYGPVQ